MSNYLISFPTGSMNHIPAAEMPDVAKAARAVCKEVIAAGVFVVTGGMVEEAASVVAIDGTVTSGADPDLISGFIIVNVPTRDEALGWAGKIAVACRCAQEVRAVHDDPDVEAMLSSHAARDI